MNTATLTDADGVTDREDETPRLDAYMVRTQTTLDILALLTLWIVVVPPGDFGANHHAEGFALAVRGALSVIYGVDMFIRSRLASRHLHYALHHPVGLASVVFPPLRVVFSVRLVKSVFQRGNLTRFLLAAGILVFNGAMVVFLVERNAPGAHIRTVGEALWFSIVTVTTVGYGDYTPVTVQGRMAAACIMAVGLITLAVITAQVASSFVSQGTKRDRALTGGTADGPGPGPGLVGDQVEPSSTRPGDDDRLAGLEERLIRIEQLLTDLGPTGSAAPG